MLAQDHGSPIRYETERHISFVLIDSTDNAPEFLKAKNATPYHFFVSENLQNNTNIGKCKYFKY